MEEKVAIIWSASALIMLAQLHEYLGEHSELSADKYVDGIHSSLSKLEKHPEACALCRDFKLAEQEYRCCNYRNHLMVYLYADQQVNILAVIHSSRSSITIKELLK